MHCEQFYRILKRLFCINHRSIALATSPGAIPDIKMMVLLGFISLLIKTSGCTIDDLHDIEFDKQVQTDHIVFELRKSSCTTKFANEQLFYLK